MTGKITKKLKTLKTLNTLKKLKKLKKPKTLGSLGVIQSKLMIFSTADPQIQHQWTLPLKHKHGLEHALQQHPTSTLLITRKDA
jgi:DNA polymerase/3'-5' exonuclease PolX